MKEITACTECKGKRLKASSLAVTINGLNIYDITSMSIGELMTFLDNLELTKTEQVIGKALLKEIKARVSFLNEVGLEYLTLSRQASSDRQGSPRCFP